MFIGFNIVTCLRTHTQIKSLDDDLWWWLKH